jgi:hypothetical protein
MKPLFLALACSALVAGCFAAPGPYLGTGRDFGPAPTAPGPNGPDGKPTVDPVVEAYVRDYLKDVLPATTAIGTMEAVKREPAFIGTLLNGDQHYGYLVCVKFDAAASPGASPTAMNEGVIVHQGRVVQWLKGGWWWEKNLCDPSKRLS